jgi:Tol biopolymer transport system component
LRQFGPLRWWPDSASFVAGGTDLKGRAGVFRIDGHSGLASPVFFSSEGDAVPYMTAISPDGASLYYRHVTSSAVRILARDVTSGTERVLWRQARAPGEAPSVLVGLSLSPDGAWIATTTKASADGDDTLRAVSVATGESRELLNASSASTQVVMWAPDSQSVFVRRSSAAGTPEVLRIPIGGGPPTTVTWSLGDQTHDFRVHPDGRRLVFVETPPDGSRGRAELRALPGIAR